MLRTAPHCRCPAIRCFSLRSKAVAFPALCLCVAGLSFAVPTLRFAAQCQCYAFHLCSSRCDAAALVCYAAALPRPAKPSHSFATLFYAVRGIAPPRLALSYPRCEHLCFAFSFHGTAMLHHSPSMLRFASPFQFIATPFPSMPWLISAAQRPALPRLFIAKLCPSTHFLCGSLLHHAVPWLLFALPCNTFAFRFYAQLNYAFADYCHALQCNAFAQGAHFFSSSQEKRPFPEFRHCPRPRMEP